MKNTYITAAKEIMESLNERSGYDSLWDDLDEGLQKEIEEDIAEILEQYYATS